MKVSMQIIVTILVLAGSGSRFASSTSVSLERSRKSLFDPIYAYDDIEAQNGHLANVQVSVQQKTVENWLPKRVQQQQQQQQQHKQRKIFNDGDELKLARISNTRIGGSRKASKRQTNSSSIDIDGSRMPNDHWDALENYYQRFRQPTPQFPTVQQQLQKLSDSDLDYNQLLRRDLEDLLQHNYKSAQRQLQSGLAPSKSLPMDSYQTSRQNPVPAIESTANSQSSQPFLSLSSPATHDKDFGFPIHNRATPELKRISSSSNLADVLRQETERLAFLEQQVKLHKQQQQLQEQYQQLQLQLQLQEQQPLQELYRRQFSQASLQPQAKSTQTNSWNNDPLKSIDLKAKYGDWLKLPEILLSQQQQQRIKHQQETFGLWYDYLRSRELLHEEAFCGPRNYFKHQTATSEASAQLMKPQLRSDVAKSQQLADTGQQTAGAGEYPSHMGVYNGTTNDENYLCAAIWVHEQFALTLATCVQSVNPNQLIVRAGEWNLNKNVSGRSMVTREIETVVLFPKYHPDSGEHNLALIKLSKPIDYLEYLHICPACQTQPRVSMKANSCWAPVRSTITTEFFDAEGEGETKEKKVANLIEVPIKLIANDETECVRQTKIEYFNFQHPNYICSADYRVPSSIWRARLNQSVNFGSGIYCNEAGNLNLVSILHPIQSTSPSAFGYMDLIYYRPWIRNVISGRNY